MLMNKDLSHIFWKDWLGRPFPVAGGDDAFSQLWAIVKREWLGIVLTLGYLVALPPLMAMTFFRKFFKRMGVIRFMVMANLILFMALLPIKWCCAGSLT